MTIRVLMIGTDLSAKGGIASVVKDYYAFGMMDRLGAKYASTYIDGTKLQQVLFFIKKLPGIIYQITQSDIVHVHSAQRGSFLRLNSLLNVARIFGKKTILHIHASQFEDYFNNAGKAEKAFIKHGLKKADAVLALSEDWKSKMSTMQPEANIVVLRNGVDIARYKPSKTRQLHDPPTYLFLGRLGNRKGVYDLVKAIEMAKDTPGKFIIAGDGEIENVKHLVASKGLSDKVVVPGWIGQEQKEELLSQADVYVLPSYNEGLPISILESMAAALPIISTPVGGIAEAVKQGENGYLVKPGDVIDLADKLVKTTADCIAWSKMCQSSLSTAQAGFSLEQIETQLLKIYKQVLPGN